MRRSFSSGNLEERPFLSGAAQVIGGAQARVRSPPRDVYMRSDLPNGRIFNLASRGLPNGALTRWSFDSMPSLLPSPLERDYSVARSCAGVPPRTSSLLS